MKDESKIPNCTNFKIQSIERYQHHIKWHKYCTERNKVEVENNKKSILIEIEKYLLNIYRFQGYTQILEEHEDHSFEMKQFSKGSTDKMNNIQVNWLGQQANYFTDSLAFTHSMNVDTDENNNFVVLLTRCCIGNTAEAKQDINIKVPMVNGVSYDCLHAKIPDENVYCFYSNEKSYPEYIIKYSIA
mmetsp:Transcript_22830/g.20308  ORF Transcript_22830/g.20308 Transcript_22830/m.20308 type:complete len:187 (+) Transcript_22830:629-1189(+)